MPGLFCAYSVCFFCILCEYCFSVRFIFFSIKPIDWLGRTSRKWSILYRVGRRRTVDCIKSTDRTRVKQSSSHSGQQASSLPGVLWCNFSVMREVENSPENSVHSEYREGVIWAAQPLSDASLIHVITLTSECCDVNPELFYVLDSDTATFIVMCRLCPRTLNINRNPVY